MVAKRAKFALTIPPIMVLGKLQLGATLLTDSPDESVVIPFFEILRSAEPVK